MSRFEGRTFRLGVMLALNSLCFLTEATFCFLTNSMVLTADAFNVLSDLLGIIIALVCMKISAKGPSDKNTYGWSRFNDLGAFINALFMITLCVTIVIEAARRFIEPEPIDQPRTVLFVGVSGLIINIIGLLLLKDYRSVTSKQSTAASGEDDYSHTSSEESNVTKKGESSHRNMYGAFLHVLADAVGSVVVIVCALIDWLLPNVCFLHNYLDPILSVLVAVTMIISSVGLIKESSMVLLQAVPPKVDLLSLRAKVTAVSEYIEAVSDLHVWQLSSDTLIASIRISFTDLLSWDQIRQIVSDVEKCFYEMGIDLVTVQPQLSRLEAPPAYSKCSAATTVITSPYVSISM